MCGIAGFFGFDAGPNPEGVVRAMADSLVHRGPDAGGVWVDADAGIGLGHRRLSILDLSPEGAQPMTSASGRYVMVFNGEVYNFAGIRTELENAGQRFRGHSDTEVLLGSFDRWGIEASVPRFAGMFSIAVWDRTERRCVLIRDRLGEKPLFFGRTGACWSFGSELKALQSHPRWRAEIDVRAVGQFLRVGYIPAPHSVFRGVHKVRPGTMIELRHGAEPVERPYWSAREAAMTGLAEPLVGTDEQLADALEATLAPVVRDEMISDVPLGAFLSGGVDSSLIVALMQRQSARPIRTYTIGFDDARFDEAQFARAVASHIGTDHTELHVSGTDALAFVEDLPVVYDEPLADSSQMPTMLVSKLTRQHVTVALSGDGGDELFGGYTHYRVGGRAERLSSRIPVALRSPIARTLGLVPDPPPRFVSRWLTDGDRVVGDRPPNALTRTAFALAAENQRDMHAVIMSQTQRPESMLRGSLRSEASRPLLAGSWLPEADAISARMLLDATAYMPDDILVKVDRAAMAFSLETRAPLLDHRVFELAWRMPIGQKIRGGVGKLPLRTLLYRYVPKDLIDRPKRGFGVPLADWLRGPLRNWAGDLLLASGAASRDWYDAAVIDRMWSAHQNREANYADRLWTLLSFAAFLEHERRRAGAA